MAMHASLCFITSGYSFIMILHKAGMTKSVHINGDIAHNASIYNLFCPFTSASLHNTFISLDNNNNVNFIITVATTHTNNYNFMGLI